MVDARRPAGVGVGFETLAAVALLVATHVEVAADEVHLLPVVVAERDRGEHTRTEAQQPGAVPGLSRLVQLAGQDLLGDPVGVSRRGFPTGVEVEWVELQMRFRDHRRGSRELGLRAIQRTPRAGHNGIPARARHPRRSCHSDESTFWTPIRGRESILLLRVPAGGPGGRWRRRRQGSGRSALPDHPTRTLQGCTGAP